MSIPRLLSALDIARDKALWDLDSKPERWVAGAPFESLDIRPGRVLLFGAPPGAGKTTFALQLMADLLERQPPLRCVVANVETAPPQLLDKLLSRLAEVDYAALQDRVLLDEERAKVDAALRDRAGLLARIGFLCPPYSMRNLFAAMVEFDARLAVVDYVQRFTAGDKEDRAKLDALMTEVRTLADRGAAVVVISSVARQKSKNGSSTYAGLSMAAFRGSAELEFGADSAYLLHRESAGVARLECVKQRFGAMRDIPLRFRGEFQRFDAGDALDGFDAASFSAPAAGEDDS